MTTHTEARDEWKQRYLEDQVRDAYQDKEPSIAFKGTAKQAAKEILEKLSGDEQLPKTLEAISFYLSLNVSAETKSDLEKWGASIPTACPKSYQVLVHALLVQGDGDTHSERSTYYPGSDPHEAIKRYMRNESVQDFTDDEFKSALSKLQTEFDKADPNEVKKLVDFFNNCYKLTPEIERHIGIMDGLNEYDHEAEIGNFINNVCYNATACLILLNIDQKTTEAKIKRTYRNTKSRTPYGLTAEVTNIEPTPNLKGTNFREIREAVKSESPCSKKFVIYNGKAAIEVSVERYLL